jgi:hypothetical protein
MSNDGDFDFKAIEQIIKQNEPHECVSDGMIYTSYPPQYRCKICGKFWYK